MDIATITTRRAIPWNKGKLLGQKPPLKLKEIWAIRIRLQLNHRIRELALFNLAIDSKLRGWTSTAPTPRCCARSRSLPRMVRLRACFARSIGGARRADGGLSQASPRSRPPKPTVADRPGADIRSRPSLLPEADVTQVARGEVA